MNEITQQTIEMYANITMSQVHEYLKKRKRLQTRKRKKSIKSQHKGFFQEGIYRMYGKTPQDIVFKVTSKPQDMLVWVEYE